MCTSEIKTAMGIELQEKELLEYLTSFFLFLEGMTKAIDIELDSIRNGEGLVGGEVG